MSRGPDPSQSSAGRRQGPVPPRRRPQGLAPQLGTRRMGHSLGVHTHSRPGGPRGLGSGRRRRPPPSARTPGPLRRRRRGEPRDRPPPCSRPRSPLRPALPQPSPPETSVGSALLVPRQPTALATTRRPLRAAHAASRRFAVSAAATSRLRGFGPAATQRQAGGSPRASNGSAANGAARPRGCGGTSG